IAESALDFCLPGLPPEGVCGATHFGSRHGDPEREFPQPSTGTRAPSAGLLEQCWRSTTPGAACAPQRTWPLAGRFRTTGNTVGTHCAVGNSALWRVRPYLDAVRQLAARAEYRRHP